MKPCKVALLAGDHSPLNTHDRDTLVRALAGDVPATVLAKALTEHGHPVSPTTVKDHRGSRCRCPGNV